MIDLDTMPASINELMGSFKDEEIVSILEMNPYFLKDSCLFLSLELQLKKEKRKSAKMVAFKRPLCIDAEECDLEKFEEDIRNKFLEWCDNDLSQYERLSYKLMGDYRVYTTSSNEHSVIKYIINKLNECTHFENDKWCELFVLSTIESHGVTSSYSYWEPPQFIVENLLKDLCEFNTSLISIGSFEL